MQTKGQQIPQHSEDGKRYVLEFLNHPSMTYLTCHLTPKRQVFFDECICIAVVNCPWPEGTTLHSGKLHSHSGFRKL